MQNQLQLNQSYLSLILGSLIVLVGGILIFNYFKSSQTLGPAQKTEEKQAGDVTPESLPGKYTVKEGDTLFKIAEKYYKDGFKFTKIAEANKLESPDLIEVGQVLEIPKLEEAIVQASPTPTPTPTQTPTGDNGKGGPVNQTVWGETITVDSYTVVEGDWLSKISGRAYGDIWKFDQIAKVNNIANPDLIFPGQVLKIPR